MRSPLHRQRFFFFGILLVLLPFAAFSQQNPVATESASILSPGRARAQLGFGEYFNQPFPLSGLEGTLTKLGMLRFGFSFDGNVELQFDGSLLDILQIQSRHDAFNAAIATTNSITGDIGDFTLWTKFRVMSEYRYFATVAIRFGVQLPNASNESGLGIDEFDFYSSLLIEKHAAGIRWVLNAGLGILGDPATLSEQHDTFIYAFGSYVPVGEATTMVFEAAGRTGHHGIGVYRLSDAKVGGETTIAGLSVRLLGVASFAPSDHSKGVELVVGYEFPILKAQ